MANSTNAKSGCFSGVLRRLLCTGKLPTHSSEALTEPTQAERDPGVVARLMGLNSLPATDWVPKQRAPVSVSRSKSVNFADYLVEFDLSQPHHRRVRTSSSFREVQQNDFFVVYMNRFEDNNKENASKSEMGFDAKRKKKENQRNETKISKLKDEPRREIGKNCSNNRSSNNSVSVSVKSTQKKPMIQKEACRGSKLKKTTRKKKKNIRHAANKTELENDPENSSPVSVLDVDAIDFSDELSPTSLKKAQYSDNEMEEGAKKKRDYSSKKREENDGYSEVVERICKLTEEDIEEANWSFKNAYEFGGFEELCRELERHVVNVLLVQTIHDLVLD